MEKIESDFELGLVLPTRKKNQASENSTYFSNCVSIKNSEEKIA
jgi:hypothetical protein